MLKIVSAIAVAFVIVLSPATLLPASADTWGCSSEKCLVACQKAGGKNCSYYCDNALKEKQRSKVCK
jgi:hypothetical protein